MWTTPDVDAAIATLRALGLRSRLRSTSGAWADFVADGGGLAGVHEGPTGVVLSFEHADVAALHRDLSVAGIESRLIDESYSLTLRLPDPDGGDELWVNQTQRDLYGYHRF